MDKTLFKNKGNMAVYFKDGRTDRGEFENEFVNILIVHYPNNYSARFDAQKSYNLGIAAIVPDGGFTEYNYKKIKKFWGKAGLISCMRCGHIWMRRTVIPRFCPHCGSANYETPRNPITVGVKPIEGYFNKKRGKTVRKNK